MSKEIRGNQLHMTLDDRINIEKCLEMDMTFKDIARFLHKDPTTISKEVKRTGFISGKPVTLSLPTTTYASGIAVRRMYVTIHSLAARGDPCVRPAISAVRTIPQELAKT